MSSVSREVSVDSTDSEDTTSGSLPCDSDRVPSTPSTQEPSLLDPSSVDQLTTSISSQDLQLLTKLEEANRLLAIKSSVNPDIPPQPTETELLAKLEAANRLLETDKKSCLTPGHSRNNSLASPGESRNALTVAAGVAPSPILGHSRKDSGTSMISNTSATSQITEEDTSGAESNLWEIWGKLVNDWASARKKPLFVKQLVRLGIPHPFRGLAWQLLLGVNNSPMKAMYVEYLKQKSPCERMISRDIARTFPEHDFFKEKDGVGQESLFNVMKAYSLHDREVGYCQGSGFIVGILLMQMPEEDAFAVLVKLMQDYRLRELFKPSMAELGLCMYKLECLIQELLPDLFQHFQTQSFHTSMYASSWFLTLFATVVPLSVAYHVMDVFISEGMDVIFRLGLALLQSSQGELLSMDMEMMLTFFQKDISTKFVTDEEKLFTASAQVRYSAKKIKRLEKEYTALKSKENEDQIELRRLRTENRLLRQRIDNLETESATLADRLIQYQLTRAQEAEDTYVLKNELSLTKQKYVQSEKRAKEAEVVLGDIKIRTDSINSASSLDEVAADRVIQSLQEELIMVRLREAENAATMKNLRNNIDELQQFNTRLQNAPSNDVQCLQEELIAVKLREAEANLSLKEMRQTITDLETDWQKHIANNTPNSPKEKSNKSELRSLLKSTQEDLMSVKIREASVLSHLKDAKQRVMELETQNQICTNQIRRMDEEIKQQKGQLDEAAGNRDDQQRQIKTLLRKIDDLESKRKEESMMARIREAENDQLTGELKQKIAAMEIQKEEVLEADRLESKGGNQELANTIFDLQEEVLQLKLSASPKSPHSAAVSPQVSSSKVDIDDYFDDDEDIEDPETLNRTLCDIIEGKRSSTSLMALLNKDDSTDCDSVQSTSSENSSSCQKSDIHNAKHVTGGSLKTADKRVVRITIDESLVKNCDTDKENSKTESAIDQSDSKNRILQTDSVTDSERGSSSAVISASQSSFHEISVLVNGEADSIVRLVDKGGETDSNDNINYSKHDTTSNDHQAGTLNISSSNGS